MQHAGVKWAFFPCWRTRCSITLGDRPVVLHRFKNTYDVALHAHASTNSVNRDASRRASPGALAVVSGRAPQGSEFVALL